MALQENDKLTCVKFEGGDAPDLIRAKKFLKIGNVYTVERFYVNNKATSIFFNEIPNISFNSIYFE